MKTSLKIFYITIIALGAIFSSIVLSLKVSACIPGDCSIGESSTWQCGAGGCGEGKRKQCSCETFQSACPGSGGWSCSCVNDASCINVTPPPSQCPTGQELCADNICRPSCGYNPECSWTDNRPNCAGDGTYCGNPQWSGTYNNYFCPGNPEWYFCCPGLWPNAQGVCTCPTCTPASPQPPTITFPVNNQIIGGGTSSVNVTWSAPSGWGAGCPDNRYFRLELYEKIAENSFLLINIYSVGQSTFSQAVPVTSGKTYRAQLSAVNNAGLAYTIVNFTVSPALSPTVNVHDTAFDLCGGRASGSLNFALINNFVNNPAVWRVSGSVPAGAQLEEMILAFVPSTGAYAENSPSPTESVLLQKIRNANALAVKLTYNNQNLLVYTLDSLGNWIGGAANGTIQSSLGRADILDIATETFITVLPAGSPIDEPKTFSSEIKIGFDDIFPNANYNVYLSATSIDSLGNRYSYNNGGIVVPNINYYFKSPSGTWIIDTFSPSSSISGERFNPAEFSTTGLVADANGIRDYFSYVTSDKAGANVAGIGIVPTTPLGSPPDSSNPASLDLIGDRFYIDQDPGLTAQYIFRLGARDNACNIAVSDLIMPPGDVNLPWITSFGGNLSLAQGTSGQEISSLVAAQNLGNIINPLGYVTISGIPAFSSYLLINNIGALPTRSLLSQNNQILNSYQNNAINPPSGTLWYDYLKDKVLKKGNEISNIDTFNVEITNASAPVGRHLNTNCILTTGVACDPDNYSAPVTVALTADFGNGDLTELGTTIANKTSTTSAQYCDGNEVAGFEFTLPSSVRANSNVDIRAYAVDLADNSRHLLNLSPKTLYCQADGDIPPAPVINQSQSYGFGSACNYEITWSDWNQQQSGYFIDISSDPAFNDFYNRFVNQGDPLSVELPAGFFQNGTGSPFVPVNNQTYYVRIYYVEYARHTPVVSFQYNSTMCIAYSNDKILAQNIANISAPSVLGIDVVVNQSNPVFSSSFNVASGSTSFYEYNGNLVLPQDMVCDIKTIIFVNGNLTINPDFTVLGDNGCLFVARGDIILKSKNKTGQPVEYDYYKFGAITDSALVVEAAGSQTGAIIDGSILSKNTPNIQRKLSLENSDQYPSILFKYDTRYRELFADLFSIAEYSIREE